MLWRCALKQFIKNGSSNNLFLAYLDTHKNKSRLLIHATSKINYKILLIISILGFLGLNMTNKTVNCLEGKKKNPT